MITDLMAPVMTPEGIGTALTLSGRKLLSRNMKFVDTIFLIEERKSPEIFLVKYKYNINDSYYRIIYVTENALFYSKDGWRSAKSLRNNFINKITNECKEISVRGIQHICYLCGERYLETKRLASLCSKECQNAISKRGSVTNKAIRGNNMSACLDENWVYIYDTSKLHNEKDTEVLDIESIEGDEGIFVDDIFMSSKKIMKEWID